ncbi:MAG: PEP-CTERM sorting domain-containing protein, partial [Akkermansia sp.]
DLAVSIDGSLDVTIVLSADELAAFNSAIWEDDAELSITLEGVHSLINDASVMFNIATVDGDITYSFISDEMDTSSGSLVIKATSDSIPEPSTATLSLLALAALLARRNKRAA